MKTHYITWWNVENLFDERDAPSERRPDSVKRKISKELSDWTAEVLDKKISNLASIFRKINGNKGPDLIGVCEVENKHVLQKLADAIKAPGRKYKIIHAPSKDDRGIDVAFIYDSKEYSFSKKSLFTHFIYKRFPTRDIVQATLKTKKGNQFVVMGNHWPARSAGTYTSEPYRIMAGENLSYFLTGTHRALTKGIPIIVMGDFNDEPYNRSMLEYALSCSERRKVESSLNKNPYLYNLSWRFLESGNFTFNYSGKLMVIDQILINYGMARKSSPFKVSEDSLRVEAFPELFQGKTKIPLRFGSKKTKTSFKGYSDHLPLSLVMIEK
jgi:predicted extracellular nuclease